MRLSVNSIARWIVPYNIWIHLKESKRARQREAQLLAASKASAPVSKFSRAAAVAFLESIGCDRTQVEEGSIPEASLRYLETFLPASSNEPLVGLHIGNFVGVSLAALASAAVSRHGQSVVVGIDPNISHRGIVHPQDKVLHLLNHFGLSQNTSLLTGFTLEPNVANDGVDYVTMQPLGSPSLPVEPSCSHLLVQLRELCPKRFDFALIDGNHDGAYLSRELEAIRLLLKPNGLLFLDDVSTSWFEIERLFEQANDTLYEKLGQDGRVGILRLKAA